MAARNTRVPLAYGLFAGVAAGADHGAASVALLEVTEGPQVALRAYAAYPFTPAERELLADLVAGTGAVLTNLAAADAVVGERFSEGLASLLKAQSVDPLTVKGIGVMGAVVWSVDARGRAPVEAGSAAVVSQRFRRPVVSGFAAADAAAGGRGGPLGAVFVRDTFGRKGRGVVVHEISGAAHLTYVNPFGTCEVAFDTGPGLLLVEAVCRAHGDMPFDEADRLAATGKVCEPFVEELLHEEFFAQAPPKFVGPAAFGPAFLKRFAKRAKWWELTFADQAATALELTARSMAEAYPRYVIPRGRVDEVVLAGRGARSARLQARLTALLNGVKVSPSDDAGFPPESLEASAAAYLAHLRLSGQQGDLPAVTGARQGAVLGAVTQV